MREATSEALAQRVDHYVRSAEPVGVTDASQSPAQRVL
jgi:hypothetical protein